MNVLVLHGPNLALLGQRPGDDPKVTLKSVDQELHAHAKSLGHTLKIVSSNHEGVLIDTLHAERGWAQAVVIDAGGLAYSSYALRDALFAIGLPAVEVQLSDSRGAAAHHRSVIEEVCEARLLGAGAAPYLAALEHFVPQQNRRAIREVKDEVTKKGPAPRPPKSLGRKSPTVELASQPPSKKSLGRLPSASTRTPPEGTARTNPGQVRPSRGDLLTRAQVRQQIADRLSGRLSSAELATWARTQWMQVQRGAPAEAGQRELLEEALQALVLASAPAGKLTDHQLIELMAQLDA